VKALLYMFGDIVMFVGRRHRALLVLGVGARVLEIRLGQPRPADFQTWFLFAVPFGFALVIFRLSQSFLRDLADLRNGRPVYEGDKLFD
jgi:TRAP-type C4-dicarboxylate transport system permease small subunit